MTTPQARQLAAEAEALLRRLLALEGAAVLNGQTAIAERLHATANAALARWARRYDALNAQAVRPMTTGIVTADGPAIRHRGVTVQLPATRTPLGAAVVAAIAAIDAGEIVACPHCGRFDCECWEWAELMSAPEPRDETTAEDLPY